MDSLAKLVPTLNLEMAMQVSFKRKTKLAIQGMAEVLYAFTFHIELFFFGFLCLPVVLIVSFVSPWHA